VIGAQQGYTNKTIKHMGGTHVMDHIHIDHTRVSCIVQPFFAKKIFSL
jgi:hypothetical protein